MPPLPLCSQRPLLAACLAVAAILRPVLAAEPVKSELPLEKVVLFTSGVGYFQHGGTVDGEATVEMSFRAENVNDLLKSMVVEDLGGGTVPAVSYASRDPITKTLGTFAVDLTDNPSIGQILGRLRGERIEVDAAKPAAGTIVGVEKRTVPVGDERTVEQEFITLLTADGLRTLPLETITGIRLVDERLQKELQQALTVLSLSHDNEKKSVSLAFRGEGERDVRVGYVQESPAWKTSYRLVLGDGPKQPPKKNAGEAKPAGQALLQGWAIVENTTDRDWKDVRMSLVSGRPISFVMDLYKPLYVPRPVVQPELYASLAPQVYGQDMDREAIEFAARNREIDVIAEAGVRQFDKKAARMAPPGPARPAEGLALRDSEDRRRGGVAAIQSVAVGEALGELFRYEIAAPVSIARQRSAMLPIVAEQVEAKKVSIYDDRVLPKHPLAGVRLVNSTTLDLMQGPVTVFDAGAYAGDARIEDLPAGSSRLLTYAVDLDVEVAPRFEPKPEEIVSVKLAKGTLVASRKLARRKIFEIKNSGGEPVNLLVEHPLDPGWKLVEPEEPLEKTRDRYRFAVTAEPGKPATLTVAEEQVVAQRLALSNLDDGMILFYSSAKVTSPAVKEALADVLERKREIGRLTQDRSRREQEIAVVEQEQNRIRQNMQQLDRNSDLYTRYVQKFATQEDKVESLRKQIAELQDTEQKARRALDEVLGKLELE